jgi:P4 family phage/plasmid primase-like protien
MTDVEVLAIQDFDDFKKGTIGLMEQKAAETCFKLGYIEYIKTPDMKEPLKISTREHAELHLAILGQRTKYHMTAKNYKTNDIKNDFLNFKDVISVATNLNEKGYTTWLSINNKESDSVEGVTHLCDYWVECDARPKGIDDRPATKEEMQITLTKTNKLKGYIENNFAAIGFMAKSGNGFHIHFPIPIFELPVEMRKEVNEKVKNFTKEISKKADVKVDNTYDINRRTTLIGTLNHKIPGSPLQTCWEQNILKDGLETAFKLVDQARTQNQKLLDSIISYEKPKSTKTVQPILNHIDIETLCQTHPKIHDLYKVGDFQKYGFPSRSEAEESLLTILAMEGYSDEELTSLMESCALGKWQEKGEAYHILSLAHARQQASEYVASKQKEEIMIEKIGASSTVVQLEEKVSVSDINPVLIAKRIVEKYHFVSDDDTKLLWYYDKTQGIYNEQSEELIKREIVRLLDTHAKARFYIDVDFWIRYSAPKVKMNKKPEYLGVENGVLNLLTRELYPTENSEKLYVTTKIPVTYNKDLTCTNILKFLKEILPEPSRLLSQEFIGFCLWGNHQFRKAYIANGPTGTGKTVHQNLNTALLGEQNISNQSIQNLNHNRFAPAELFNKMGNFCDDMPASIVKVTGNFKMATGSGRMAAERKGKDPFYFRNRAKLWLNCNDLAPIQKSEDCDAYYERLLIVDYKQQMKGKENPNLFNEINTPEELSGYLNYALEGLNRLIANKKFSEIMTKEDVRATYVKRTDSSKYFVENYIIVTDDDKDFVFSEELFQQAVKVCHKEKIRPMNKGELTNAIQQFCPGAHFTQIRDGPKAIPKRAWRFIKIKEFEVTSPQKQLVSSLIVADVAKEATPPISPELFENKKEVLEENRIGIVRTELDPPATNATSATKITVEDQFIGADTVCGICSNFHKPSCGHPMDWENLKEDNPWAYNCQSFIRNKNEMSNPGADM